VEEVGRPSALAKADTNPRERARPGHYRW
jgi:hypothetical protein